MSGFWDVIAEQQERTTELARDVVGEAAATLRALASEVGDTADVVATSAAGAFTAASDNLAEVTTSTVDLAPRVAFGGAAGLVAGLAGVAAVGGGAYLLDRATGGRVARVVLK